MYMHVYAKYYVQVQVQMQYIYHFDLHLTF